MNDKRSARFRFTASGVFLIALALLVPAMREGNPLLYMLFFGVTGATLLGMVILPRLFSLDRILFTLSLYLSLIPVMALAWTDPDGALSRTLACAAGIASLLIGASLIRLSSPSLLTGLVTAFLGLLLLAVRLADASFPVSLTVPAAVLLLTACASLLSGLGGLPAFVPGAAGILMLFLQGCPVDAALLGLVFFLMLWCGGSGACWGIPVLLAALFLAGRLAPPLFLRVSESNSSSLSRLLSAGLFGTSLETAAGDAEGSSLLLYPVADSFGLLFAGLTLPLHLPLALRGLFVASVSRTRFHACLALGCSVLLACRTLIALLAAFEVVPLPLTEVPLWSSSLPDLCSWFFALGLVCGISGRNDADLAEDAHLAMLAK